MIADPGRPVTPLRRLLKRSRKRASAAFVGAIDRVLAPLGRAAVPLKAAARFEEAAKYQLYWRKAAKKIEIRELPGFGPLAAKAVAEHRTGMREDRLYTLWQAVAGLSSDEHAIAEVGAFRGGSARFIGEALRWHGRSNAFFVCDTFAGHAAVDEALDGPHKVGDNFANTSFEEVAAYLADLPQIELVRGDFRETSRELEAHAPFAFAHLDVDVYPATRHCLEFFGARILPGGLIVVDDYGFTTCRGARQATDEFARSHPEFRLVHLLTGQALLLRRG
jgi:O-methyltransferase